MKRFVLTAAVFAALMASGVASAAPVTSYASCFPARGELAIVRSNTPREQRVMMCAFARQLSALVATNPNPSPLVKVNGEFFSVVPGVFNGYRTFYFQETGSYRNQIAVSLATTLKS